MILFYLNDMKVSNTGNTFADLTVYHFYIDVKGKLSNEMRRGR